MLEEARGLCEAASSQWRSDPSRRLLVEEEAAVAWQPIAILEVPHPRLPPPERPKPSSFRMTPGSGDIGQDEGGSGNGSTSSDIDGREVEEVLASHEALAALADELASPVPRPLPRLPPPSPEPETEADIISTVEFDHTGDYLATGDKGGRVVLFERNESVSPTKPETC